MASFSQSFLAYFQKKNLQIILLGCLSGIPLGLLIDPLNYWLAEAGIEKSTIGLFSLILIVYTIKALWAPLIDRLSLPILNGLGQRRSWLIFSQIVTGCFVISLGMIDPNSNILFFAYIAFFISIFSATQDICVDALRIELVQKKELGEASSVYVIGYRIGAVLISQVIGLYLAEIFGFQTAYVFLGLFFIGFSILTFYFLDEPDRIAKPMLSPFTNFGKWLKDSFLDPYLDLFLRYKNHLIILLLVMFTYRLSDIFLGPMAMPFYQFLGFTKSEVATYTNLYGLSMTIAGGLFGGLLVHRFGIASMLIAGSILAPLTNLFFLLLYNAGKDLSFLILTITADNFTQGFVVVVVISLLSSVVSKTYTATQYAGLFLLGTLPSRLISSSSGFIVDSYGFGEFFIICALSGIPAIIFTIMLVNTSFKLSLKD